MKLAFLFFAMKKNVEEFLDKWNVQWGNFFLHLFKISSTIESKRLFFDRDLLGIMSSLFFFAQSRFWAFSFMWVQTQDEKERKKYVDKKTEIFILWPSFWGDTNSSAQPIFFAMCGQFMSLVCMSCFRPSSIAHENERYWNKVAMLKKCR